MSIHLTMQVDDPETESLLIYLESRFGSNNVHKVRALKLAQGWLELMSPGAFSGEEPAKSLLVSQAHAMFSASQSPSDKLSPHQQDKHLSQEFGR